MHRELCVAYRLLEDHGDLKPGDAGERPSRTDPNRPEFFLLFFSFSVSSSTDVVRLSPFPPRVAVILNGATGAIGGCVIRLCAGRQARAICRRPSPRNRPGV